MTIHQCPKCELRFEWKTEVDDHCRRDHPEFRHEYPAVARRAAVEDRPVTATPAAVPHRHEDVSVLVRWMIPRNRSGAHHN